jgi:AcrR family transcriptional regulator
MPRTKEQYEAIRTEKRQLILDIALKLFAENGYASTSIDKIAKEAAISKGLMYNYFKSKEELLQKIWDELMTEFENMIDPNHDGEITDSEAEDFIDKLFEHLQTKRHIYKFFFQLSFQPKVVEFLHTVYNPDKARQQQNLIIAYFSKKLPYKDMKVNYFTTLVFFKGLSMVTTYTEHSFDNDFLEQYKQGLKSIFFPKC